MKTFINVLLGKKKQQNCRRVEFIYDDEANPTIADVKDAARAQLNAALEGCTVNIRMPNNTTATLADDERFLPDDNIWIDATDSGKRSRTSVNSTVSDEAVNSVEDDTTSASETYIIRHKKTTLTLFRRDTYLEWNTDNDAAIRILYEMSKPTTDLFLGNINIYDYYDSTMTRGLIVLAYYRNAVPNLAVFEDAKRRLRHSTTDMAFKAFTTNEFTIHANATTEVLNKWLKTSFIPTWSAAGSDSPISQALRSRGYRERKTSGIRKPVLKKFKRDNSSVQSGAFTAVLEAMKVATDNVSLENMYKSTSTLRRSWLVQLLQESNTFEEAIEIFFDELQFMEDNLHWIHYDYEECMQKNYEKIPKFGEGLSTFATSIISTATQQSLSVDEDEDTGLTAAEAITQLINKYCKPKDPCKFDSIMLKDTEKRNENDLLLIKNAITVKPMIIMTSDDDGRCYYIAFQNRMLKVHQADFADALQCYMEVYYVFDLAYDPSPAPFFDFFSLMEGIHKTSKPSLQNLLSSIQFVYDTTHPAEEEEPSDTESQNISDEVSQSAATFDSNSS